MYPVMVGKQKQWNITKGSDDTEQNQTNFAGIAGDGTIFSSDASQITIDIQGSQGVYREVLVFAYHVPVTEPVENPVTFMAFWSEGTSSFFDMYQKSLDPCYPLSEDNREINFNNNLAKVSELTYNYLVNQAKSACTYFNNNEGSLVLMGIYGTGSNTVTGTNEDFALVPWDGSFPSHLPYTPGINSLLKESLNRIETILGNNTSKNSKGLTTIDSLLENLENDILQKLDEKIAAAILPTGSIILWSGETIPDGWAEYTNAAGRVVVGYAAGGITVPAGLTGTLTNSILTSVGALYNPPSGQEYSSPLTTDVLPKHRHAIGVNTGAQDNSSDATKITVQNWDNRNSSLTGDYGGKYGTSVGVKNGGLFTSVNFTDNDNQGTQTVTQWNASKLPKAITLRYIIKL
jgi:hypothetical protein